MANIQVFEYQNNKVRTVDVDGEAWFVLKDVCEVLHLGTTAKVAERLDDDEKGILMGTLLSIRPRRRRVSVRSISLISS